MKNILKHKENISYNLQFQLSSISWIQLLHVINAKLVWFIYQVTCQAKILNGSRACNIC